MLDDPDFYSGTGDNLVLNWKKLQGSLAQLFPDAGFNKYSGTPNQVFTKGISEAILQNMQNALGGLGQVRIAEIDLLKQAMASPNNTIEANRVLLNMAIRTQERLQKFAAMAHDYATGSEVINPFNNNEVLMPATPDGKYRAGGGIDSGYNRMLQKLVTDNPPFTPEEISGYKDVWAKDKASTSSKPSAPTNKPLDLKQFNRG